MLRLLCALLLVLPSLAFAQPGPQPIAGSSASTATVTPTGASSATTLAALAAQQGVLLDTFALPGDADDTASMTRAVTAGVPILLGARTYTINNFSMAGTPTQFILKGVKNASVIQRTSASGSQFFKITAASVYIDGVTFDMNSGAVSANQWGVYLGTGGQVVSVRNSVFKNNSGSLGTCFALLGSGPSGGGQFYFGQNEVTNCSFNSLFFGSVSNGLIDGNYIHNNGGGGIDAQVNGTASSTNYLTDVVISHNTVVANTGSGISVGGFGPPYIYGTPQANHVKVSNNIVVDNSNYEISTLGDYIDIIDNDIGQSSSSVAVYGGIDCNARYGILTGNKITIAGTPSWGIDCGGAVGMNISDNTITMPSGTAIDIGGNINTISARNTLYLSGSAHGFSVVDVESDGSNVPFPQHASNVVIDHNNIVLQSSTTMGVTIYDDAGAFNSTSYPIYITNNNFVVSGSGSNSAQDITYYSTGTVISGNTHNGTSLVFSDPNGNGDVVVDSVWDNVQGISSTSNIRSVVNQYISTYGSGGSILYVIPTAGGSNYGATTTTLAASGSGGGSGWTGSAEISQGVIIGVRTATVGSGYSGTITITATDSSASGSGATFTAVTTPKLPQFKKLIFTPVAGNLFQKSGGYIGIANGFPVFLQQDYPVSLLALTGGSSWTIQSYTPGNFAVGSLPTCNSTSNGAFIIVTGSTTSKWQARCNGTNWLWPDGTTVSG